MTVVQALIMTLMIIIVVLLGLITITIKKKKEHIKIVPFDEHKSPPLGENAPFTQKLEQEKIMPLPQKGGSKFWKICKKILNHIFIEGLGGMALGLFATLIIGTIICQIGSFIGGEAGKYINAVGTFAKIMMGMGIGVGVAYKFKKTVLVGVSAGVAGMIGAYAAKIIEVNVFDGNITSLGGVGEPLGAFIAAIIAIDIGALVAGKTKVDIILTPIVCIVAGSIVGLLVGPPVSVFMAKAGDLVNWATVQQPFLMGMLVSALMGIALTLPISSAAIGVTLKLSGIAAGAATVGCCCQMVGFAVMSFKENRVGGLFAQGLGTSMLQMPNIIKRPVIWLPPIIASLILGPISSVVLNMTSNMVGAGMGTAGLVGPLMTLETMMSAGTSWWVVLLEILGMYIIAPAIICWALGLLFRRLKWIRPGDLKLEF